MKFIPLTYEHGVKTFIDITKAREIFRRSDLTYIYYNDMENSKVKETIEEIFNLINE